MLASRGRLEKKKPDSQKPGLIQTTGAFERPRAKMPILDGHAGSQSKEKIPHGPQNALFV
jgi:hypothetical protein